VGSALSSFAGVATPSCAVFFSRRPVEGTRILAVVAPISEVVLALVTGSGFEGAGVVQGGR